MKDTLPFIQHSSFRIHHFSSAGLWRRSFLSFSHLSLCSPVRSLGRVSTGMPASAQNVRQRRKRESNCPVPSGISFVTFGFSFATAALLLRVNVCRTV